MCHLIRTRARYKSKPKGLTYPGGRGGGEWHEMEKGDVDNGDTLGENQLAVGSILASIWGKDTFLGKTFYSSTMQFQLQYQKS